MFPQGEGWGRATKQLPTPALPSHRVLAACWWQASQWLTHPPAHPSLPTPGAGGYYPSALALPNQGPAGAPAPGVARAPGQAPAPSSRSSR